MISFEAWCNCKGTGVQAVPLQNEVIYAICQYCDGSGVITIKGEEMEEQENKQPFAYEEYVELKKRFEEVRDEMYKVRSNLHEVRDVVRNFFQERYAENDYPDDLTFDIDEINTLLNDIKASELSKTFDASATVDITFRVIAENAEDAASIIHDYISDLYISVNNDDDYEVDNVDVHVND